ASVKSLGSRSSINAISRARRSINSGVGAPTPSPCTEIFPKPGCEFSFIYINESDWRTRLCARRGRELSSYQFASPQNKPVRIMCQMIPLRDEIFLRENSERVAFSEYGDPNGEPVIFCHGWPSSRVIAVVSGAPNIAELGDHSGLLVLYRWLMFADQRLPAPLCRFGFRLARPLLSLRPPRRSRSWLLKFLQPCDADSLRDELAFEACFESQRRAWKASAAGVLADAQLFAQPWGFSLNELQV